MWRDVVTELEVSRCYSSPELSAAADELQDIMVVAGVGRGGAGESLCVCVVTEQYLAI